MVLTSVSNSRGSSSEPKTVVAEQVAGMENTSEGVGRELSWSSADD